MGKEKLNSKQLKFVDIYMETADLTLASIQAGYTRTTKEGHRSNANRLVRMKKINDEIKRRQAQVEKHAVATSQDVMEFFTKAMNGEIKDQFGLEATLSDRLRAGMELAKRTVDIDNKLAGKTDPNINITLSWDE